MKDDFRIGEWLVRPRINSLERDGEVQHLEPKVMRVLVTLAGEPGDVVTRHALRSAVWPDVFVGDDVLIRAISEIRRAFGDDPRTPHTVQTVPKVGYRLIAPVVNAEMEARSVEAQVAWEPLLAEPPSLELASTLAGLPSLTTARRQWFVWAGLGVLVVVLAVLALFMTGSRSKKVEDFTVHPLTTYPGQELQPAFAPDGQSVAFVWHKPDEGPGHIYIKGIGSEAPVRLLAGTDAEYSPAWSPDGRTIALIRRTANASIVETVPAAGGVERQVYTLPFNSVWEYGGLTWTSDAQNLIFPQRSAPGGPSLLVELSLASHAITPLTTPKDGWDGDWMPSMSPDGQLLSFTRGSERSARDLYVMDFPGGSPRRVTSDNRLIVGTSWTPTGSEIVFASNRGGSMALWRVAAKGGAPLHESVGTENAYGPTIAFRGSRLAYSHGSAQWKMVQVEWNGEETKEQEILTSSEQDAAPSISPNGDRLAFQSWRSGSQEIWVADANGKNPTLLTQSGNFSGSPAWSPAGDRIAFDERLNGFARVCMMGAHGEGSHALPGGSYDDIVPSWSADGSWLYFGSNRSGSWQVWRTAADGSGAAQQMSVNGGMVARESPDGRWVYYTRLGVAGLWKRSVSGGPETKVSNSPPDTFQDYWTVTKQAIFLIQSQNGRFVLAKLDPETGRTRIVYAFQHDPGTFAGVTVSPDGKRFILAELARAESNITLVENFR